jgi:hypothetical protein
MPKQHSQGAPLLDHRGPGLTGFAWFRVTARRIATVTATDRYRNTPVPAQIQKEEVVPLDGETRMLRFHTTAIACIMAPKEAI